MKGKIKIVSIVLAIIVLVILIIIVNNKVNNNKKIEQQILEDTNKVNSQIGEENNNYQSFIGKVVETERTYIIVEPNENEEERKSSDKYRIFLGENNDMIYPVGTILEITYTGVIKDTYPSQIDVINIEIKSVSDFELQFKNDESKQVKKIIDKEEIEQFSYNVYSYNGNVNIKINDEVISLKDALINNKISIDEIIQKANQDLEGKKITGDVYKDGGSMIYKYPDYTIIKYHNLDGNRDVYIGSSDMDIFINQK